MGGIYWLASYPKSGNTWFRAFLRNLQLDQDVPVDINDLGTERIASARRWLDVVLGFDTADLTWEETERLRPDVYRWSARNEEVGYHKIHDAYSYRAGNEPLVSREATLGALYILRNPLDVAVSAANHWHCGIDQAIARMGNPKMFLSGGASQVAQRLSTWSGHVLSWVDAPGLRCEIVRYEDLLDSPRATFARAAAFLRLPDDARRLDKAIRFSAFPELSRQEAEKGFCERPQSAKTFFRIGKSGGWRDRLNRQQADRIVDDHGEVMRRFGYLDESGEPV